MSKKTIDSMISEPLVNLQPCLQDLDRITEVTKRIYHKFAESSFVNLHKQAFGPQDYCFAGEYRYWVWHDSSDRYRLFVSDRSGIGFEVNAEVVKSASEGVDLFEEYADELIKAVS